MQNRASAGIWSLWTPIVTKLCQNPGDRLWKIATGNENAVEPGTNVSLFKTHNATGLRDGQQDTSLCNFGMVIGIDRHQH